MKTGYRFGRQFKASAVAFAIIATIIAPRAHALTSTGTDGAFLPSADRMLLLPGDGLFNFTDIDIENGADITFSGASLNIYLLATGDIVLDGILYAPGRSLFLETPGALILNGQITADSIYLVGDTITFYSGSRIKAGSLTLCTVGNCDPESLPAPAVPEPTDYAFMLSGLLLLGLYMRCFGSPARILRERVAICLQ